MFKIAYIVLAHNNPAQLVKLLKAIESDDHCIFLHIDKRTSLNQFTTFEGFKNIKNLSLLPRFKSYWGGIGLVEATLKGIYKAVRYNCANTILLSGADYPIKSLSDITAFLDSNKGKSFITHHKLPLPHWIPDQEINRIKKYYFHVNGKLFEYPNHPEVKTFLRKILNILLGFFLRKERTFPNGIIPYGGEQWFCLSLDACRNVIDFHEHHPELLKFLRYSLIPDEIFFQTALLNTSNEELLKNIVNQTITYVNWKNKNNPSPSCFEINDFEKLATSDRLFARKFDLAKFPNIIKEIDEKLLQIK